MDKIKPDYYRNEDGFDLIESFSKTMTEDGFRGFMTGNVMKYVQRYHEKNGIEDLDKADYYTFRLKIWEITNHTTTIPTPIDDLIADTDSKVDKVIADHADDPNIQADHTPESEPGKMLDAIREANKHSDELRDGYPTEDQRLGSGSWTPLNA